MRLRFTAILILVVSFVSLSSYGIATSLALHEASVAVQGHSGRGLVRIPGRGQALEASMPVTLNWTLDNPAEVESQDLILSIDGGLSFKTMIAAHLPPNQQQLIWAATYHNATERDKLKVSLHLVNGGIDEIISDDFSILPAPRNPAVASEARKRVMEGSAAPSDVGAAEIAPLSTPDSEAITIVPFLPRFVMKAGSQIVVLAGGPCRPGETAGSIEVLPPTPPFVQLIPLCRSDRGLTGALVISPAFKDVGLYTIKMSTVGCDGSGGTIFIDVKVKNP